MDFIDSLEKQDHSNTNLVINWIRTQIPDSKIPQALIDDYMSDNRPVIAVVIDPTSALTNLTDLIAKSLQALDLNDPKILVFGQQTMLIDVIHIIPMPPQYYIKLLTHIKYHIITGSTWSWYMSAMADMSTRQCVSPATYPMGYHQFPYTQIVDVTWSHSLWFDHIYYINLDRRPDRRAAMEKQLQKWHLSATRIAAVDGNTLKWTASYGIEGIYWNPRSLGYCMSYRKALQDALDKGYEKILVLDDDAVFTDNFVEVLTHAYKSLPKKWNMLYFGANHGENVPTEMLGGNLMRLKCSYSSHAIILHRRSYEHFLQFLENPYGPLDIYFSVYQQFFPCFITEPRISYQSAGYSDILNKDVDYKAVLGAS